MIELLEMLLDSLAIFFALGIVFYGSWLARLFKGGLFYKPLRLLAYSSALFAVGEFFDLLHSLGLGSEIFVIIHVTFELLFLAALLAGILFLYRALRKA